MPVNANQLEAARAALPSFDDIDPARIPDVAILNDRTFSAAFTDWRAELQQIFDSVSGVALPLAAEARANRKTAAALRAASIDVDALRELLLAGWGGMAADAAGKVVAKFAELLRAVAECLDALSDHDAALLSDLVTNRVQQYRELVDAPDQQDFLDDWQAQLTAQADLVAAWDQRRAELLAGLNAAAEQLPGVQSADPEAVAEQLDDDPPAVDGSDEGRDETLEALADEA